jgi:hypothetical protein
LKTYEHVKYVYELIGKNNYALDWKASENLISTEVNKNTSN